MPEFHIERDVNGQVEFAYLTLLGKLENSISGIEDAISEALEKDEILLAKALTKCEIRFRI